MVKLKGKEEDYVTTVIDQVVKAERKIEPRNDLYTNV